MSTKSLVDELSEDREKDERIIKSFYSKSTLSPDIFEKTDGSYKMIDSVRQKLLSIADKFIDFLGVDFFIHDAVLTGSLANYNWSEYSDVDIHILIDYQESGHNIKLLQEFFDAKRKAWNLSHDIMIAHYEAELYVQDVHEKHISSGVFSILNNKWIIEPQNSKQKIDDRKILEMGEEYAKTIDELVEKKKKGDDVTKEIDDVRKKIKRFRQSGLDEGGELSYENLTFKLLRRNGYIEKLLTLKKQSVQESILYEFIDRDIIRFEKEAINHYGVTDVIRYAGYLTPSGYLLDFSEGSGSRAQDHRNIGYIFDLLGDVDMGKYGGEDWKNSQSTGMYAAMDMGFIRVLPESYGLDIHTMPTQNQFGVIRQMILRRDGEIIIEMNEDAYVEYESGTPEDYIIDGIKAYYREGIKPKAYSDVEDEEFF